MVGKIKRKLVRSVPCGSILENQVGRFLANLLPARVQESMLEGFTTPQSIELKISGLDFSILTSSEDDHFRSAFLKRLKNWEVKPLAAWIDLVEENSTVIDVGAYLGVYSILALRAGAGNVIAYEPNFRTLSRLEKNLDLNGFHDRTIIREVALSDVTGVSRLLVPKNREYSSGAQLVDSSISREVSNWETLSSVQTLTLDEDLVHVPIEKISIIKIDAEGFEFRVLTGAITTLRKFQPSVLIEVFGVENLIKVENLLRSIGYNRGVALDGFDTRNHWYKILKFRQPSNYLFTHSSKVRE
jgi:FkbM family methyltransferase